MIKKSETVDRAAAKQLGYIEQKILSKGVKVYKRGRSAKGPKYITRDKTSHIGGAWKEATTPENLARKHTRSGTYDVLLKKTGD